MKFKTQHIRVANGHNAYQLHRDGKDTWETKDGGKGDTAIYNVIHHTSVAQAKAEMGSISSTGRK